MEICPGQFTGLEKEQKCLLTAVYIQVTRKQVPKLCVKIRYIGPSLQVRNAEGELKKHDMEKEKKKKEAERNYQKIFRGMRGFVLI